MMMYVSISSLFWTHLIIGVVSAAVASGWVYFAVKK